jgi:glycerol-3-phosphate acyltransferase PlsY
MTNIFANNFLAALTGGAVPEWMIAACAVAAYFIGNINPAILIGKASGIDIRSQGSGNAGTTNALRSLGKKAGVATFLIDVAKGFVCFFVPVWLFLWQAQHQSEAYVRIMLSSSFSDAPQDMLLTASPISAALLCGLCVVLGHMYPVVFGFRGGKGVATAFGVMLGVNWLFALLLFGIVLVVTAVFRRVSLSVLCAVAVALVLVIAFPGADEVHAGVDALWLIVLLALIVWKHRANIGRLVKGKEPKLSFGGKKPETDGE